MWVYVTDVLDEYGRLVYDRIRSKVGETYIYYVHVPIRPVSSHGVDHSPSRLRIIYVIQIPSVLHLLYQRYVSLHPLKYTHKQVPSYLSSLFLSPPPS